MPPINVTQVLQMASAAHTQRQWAQAEKLYQQILSADPKQADALHLYGILLHQTGRTPAGIELIRRAIALNARNSMYHANLAMVYSDLRQFTAAAECLQNACVIDPTNPALRLRLAFSLNNELGRPADAVPIYKAVLATDPKSTDALFGLALALHRLGDISAALEHYRQALALAPNETELLSNFAAALLATGEAERAIEMYNAAIAIAPAKAILWYNLGVAHMSLEATEPAIAALQKAIELNPTDLMSQVNMAALLRTRGDVEQAAQLYTTLVEKHPQIAELHSNLGLTRQGQGRQDEAIAELRQAVALDPNGVNVYDNLLMGLHYQSDYTAAQLYADHIAWGEFVEGKITPRVVNNDPSPNRRLRIGYVSPDFRQHSVSFFVEPILAGHDRRAMEVFCYANQPTSDATTARLRSHADHWRNIYALSDDAAADLIQKDQIDILIDLAVHTQANRLKVFARKPAPLQGTYLGYAATTGLRNMDFRLTDNWVDPPGVSEEHHAETLVRLPNTQWVYRPLKDIPDISPLPADANGHITFGVATNLAKINSATIAMWCQTMQAVAGSVLIIKGTGMEDVATRQQFLDRFASAGVSENRVRCEPSTSLSDYFHFFSRIDVVLDTFPFAGGTTSRHALYMGVPVITRSGDTSVSRVGASLLHNVDLSDLIADFDDKFAHIAIELSSNLARLRQIRGTLRQTMWNSPLMNEPEFVRNLQAAYRNLWKEWCSKQENR